MNRSGCFYRKISTETGPSLQPEMFPVYCNPDVEMRLDLHLHRHHLGVVIRTLDDLLASGPGGSRLRRLPRLVLPRSFSNEVDRTGT